MQVIVSHTNLDFDGLASMIAAKKLYPEAEIIMPSKVSSEVNHFLAIYKDTFPFKRLKDTDWERVEEVIMVDTNSPSRLGDIRQHLPHAVKYAVYDHHPETEETVQFHEGKIEKTGAAVTILSELIKEKNLPVSPFEATVFSLGVYSDTGAFTYDHTTARDLSAAAFFLEQGANLKVIDQFRESSLTEVQQQLFQKLLDNSEIISVDGVDILIASHRQPDYTGHLAQVTRKLLQVTGADAAFSVAEMGKKTFVTARVVSERINALPVIHMFHGGGHEKAASATINKQSSSETVQTIKENLSLIVRPSLTAKDMMSSPVRVVAPETSIETVSKMLYRYGHTGFPVVEDEKLRGIISRRDVDKALHHKLGHAPVKGYMSHNPIAIGLHEKIETIRELMIEDHVGRLPVIDNGELVGIVSRTDVIQAMHGKTGVNLSYSSRSALPLKRQMTETMRKYLSPTIFQLLELIGEEAGYLSMRAYLIGGMVRDLMLQRDNEDMDIVVEGDGISLALHLQKLYGGKVRKHDEFRTATWKHPSGFKVDLTSARTEYYDFPAALPKVELSTIKEDLFRRDFTINAMGICLNQEEFGELLDYFHGYEDLNKEKLRVLYNLSFVEDPTRILRAVRFESRFNFSMDEQTERLAVQSANNLLSVSKPRLSSELIRLFTEENASEGVKRMRGLTLIKYLLTSPGDDEPVQKRIDCIYYWHSVFKEQGIAVNRSIWMAYMFSLTTGRVNGEVGLEGFCLTKEDVKTLNDLYNLLISHQSRSIDPSLPIRDIHVNLATMKPEPLFGYFAIKFPGQNEKLFNYLLTREKLTRKVDGNDLKKLGLKPGPYFKEILLEVDIKQLENPEISKEKLIGWVNHKFLSK
ncbi:CBS domain-containing protein [Salipaludibacillus sp. CUR1]|uniref:CBS domain-containing protein n=1 Tax=Salipaludibacillus sp. CUR1 TaxID=2820003 RepID=UPI001E4AE505|nr:CBS domain-containing protein [Salipaludibacillus sp. CUR1]MCE7794159.1 CBS domain-containing protein [Salipaludibacillus sp. CUR1]